MHASEAKTLQVLSNSKPFYEIHSETLIVPLKGSNRKLWKCRFKLMTELLELVSKGLGLEPDAIAKQAEIHDPGAAIRTDFNCYPPCPQPKLVLGSAPHCDRGVLTVLQQDRVSGLQVAKEGNWFPVPPMKDAFVINRGDQMQALL